VNALFNSSFKLALAGLAIKSSKQKKNIMLLKKRKDGLRMINTTTQFQNKFSKQSKRA